MSAAPRWVPAAGSSTGCGRADCDCERCALATRLERVRADLELPALRVPPGTMFRLLTILETGATMGKAAQEAGTTTGAVDKARSLDHEFDAAVYAATQISGRTPYAGRSRLGHWYSCPGPVCGTRYAYQQRGCRDEPCLGTAIRRGQAPPAAYRNNQVLPETFAEVLRTLHRQAPSAMDGVILALQDAGWNNTAIGVGLEMSREAIRKRADRARDTLGIEPIILPTMPPPPLRDLDPETVTTQLSDDDAEELARLHDSVRAVEQHRAHHTDEGERLIATFHRRLVELNEVGISISRLAAACGTTQQAMQRRITRHRRTYPSSPDNG